MYLKFKHCYLVQSENSDSMLHIFIATGFFTRLVGLLGTKRLPQNHVLLFRSKSGVHTVGMKYAIDIYFLSAAGRLLAVHKNVAPNRMVFAPKGVSMLIESSCDSTVSSWLSELNYFAV